MRQDALLNNRNNRTGESRFFSLTFLVIEVMYNQVVEKKGTRNEPGIQENGCQ